MSAPALAQSEFKFKEGRVSLSFDIDSREKILQARFLMEGDLFKKYDFVAFDKACHHCEGQKISDLFKQDWSSFFFDHAFSAFPWLLRQAVYKYWGVPQSLEGLGAGLSSELVCRCFGVYRSQLEKLIKERPEVTTQELALKTRASLGCTSCAGDLAQILLETREAYQLKEQIFARQDKQGFWVRPMGLTPAQAVLKLAPLFEKWLKTRPELKNQVLEIIDLCGHRVLIRGELEKEQIQSLQDYWHQHLEVRFTASLFLELNLQ